MRRAREQKARQESLDAARAHMGGSNDSVGEESVGLNGEIRVAERSSISKNSLAASSGNNNGVIAGSTGHPGDVFLRLLEIYFSPEYAQLWAERFPAAAAAVASSAAFDASAPQAHDSALALLNKHFHLLDTVSLLKLLPPTLPLHTLSHLFSRLFPSTLHTRRHNHVVSGMHKLVHLRVQSHCFALRSLHLSLDAHVKCGWCYKAINDAVFVAYPYHAVRDPVDHNYIIDFENGGAPPTNITAAEAIDHPQLLQEMPRYVLVHSACSALFKANGGTEALLNSDAGAPRSASSNIGGSGLQQRERGASSMTTASSSVTSVSVAPRRG